VIIVDAHQDIAWNYACYDRDYRISALAHREREAQLNLSQATMGLPDSMLGHVGLIFATLFSAPAKTKPFLSPYPNPTYRDEHEAYANAIKQLDYYNRMADEDGRIQLVRTQTELDTVIASWDKEMPERKQGLVILMEGADPILEPQQFEEWYERGIRIVGTSWSMTRYAGGTGEPGGLTHLGYELLENLANYHTILDLSHMAEQAFLESVDRYEGHLIASHSNPRRFCDSDRHLSDAMIQRLAERDGVMGVVLYNRFLSNTWSKGDPRLPLSIVADVIDHVCQITGSANHVGIGSDFDGGFGAEQLPEGLETSGDLSLIADVLRERGYDETGIEAIMGGNFIKKLRQSLPAN
jgi:membrane dipeptidase